MHAHTHRIDRAVASYLYRATISSRSRIHAAAAAANMLRRRRRRRRRVCVRQPHRQSVSVSQRQRVTRPARATDRWPLGDVNILGAPKCARAFDRDSASRVNTTWDATPEREDAVVVVRAAAAAVRAGRAGRRRRRRRVMGARTRLRAGHRWVGKRTGEGRGEEGWCRRRMHRER